MHLISSFFVCHLSYNSDKDEVVPSLSLRWHAEGSSPLPPDDNLIPFLYPFGLSAVKPREYMPAEELAFTLTAGDGSRLHGFCRHCLPPSPGGHLLPRLPHAVCIISELPWSTFFWTLLRILDLRAIRHTDSSHLDATSLDKGSKIYHIIQDVEAATRAASEELASEMLATALMSGAEPAPAVGKLGDHVSFLPLPLGLTLTIADASFDIPRDTSGWGPDLADTRTAQLLWYITPRQAVTLIASLLLECRVVLASASAKEAALAVYAAAAMLAPFRWQHIFLPLLPLALHDYLAAPMPYLIGVPMDARTVHSRIGDDEVAVFDLDRMGLVMGSSSMQDDAFLLPGGERLESVLDRIRDRLDGPEDGSATPLVASSLVEFFTNLVGNYRKCIVVDSNTHTPPGASEDVIRCDGLLFDQGTFEELHRKNPRLLNFTRQIKHSQLFEVFVRERLAMVANGFDHSLDPFETAVSEKLEREESGMNDGRKQKIGKALKRGTSIVRTSTGGILTSIKSLGSKLEESYSSAPIRRAASLATSTPLERKSGPLEEGLAVLPSLKVNALPPEEHQLKVKRDGVDDVLRPLPVVVVLEDKQATEGITSPQSQSKQGFDLSWPDFCLPAASTSSPKFTPGPLHAGIHGGSGGLSPSQGESFSCGPPQHTVKLHIQDDVFGDLLECVAKEVGLVKAKEKHEEPSWEKFL